MKGWFAFLGVLLLSAMGVQGGSKPPNIVFILTDDQDVLTGGMNHMDNTKKYLEGFGARFDNMFTTTPGSCASRSSILSGKYAHNHKAYNNSLEGGCGNENWIDNVENKSFAIYLKDKDYNTFYAGVYHNQYGKAKGDSHVPAGWDTWFGLVGAAKYFDYDVSVNGEVIHYGEQPDDYLTDVMMYKARDFLVDQTQDGPPFLMVLAPPAAHGKFTPHPQYQNQFLNEQAPRTGSFNKKAKDKHWLVAKATSPMTQETIDWLDEIYRNRSRTLLSVDVLVQDMVFILEGMELLDNTYVVYSSDNGYHLGQFSLQQGKRLPYESDIRVPFLARGMDIKPGQVIKEPVLNIDLAPTFLDMAGIEVPDDMDGKSFLPILKGEGPDDWRTDFLVEYWGESEDRVYPYCPEKSHQDVFQCNDDCTCEDSTNNTYSCVRTLTSSDDLMYCMFKDDVGFEEYYNLNDDRDELINIAPIVAPNVLKQQNQRMSELQKCSGESCQEDADNEDNNPNSLQNNK